MLSDVRKIHADPQYKYGRPVGYQVFEGTERIAAAFVSILCS